MHDRIRILFAIGSLAGGGSERQVVNILRHIDRSRFEPLLYLVNRAGEFLGHVPDDVPIIAFDDEPPTKGFYLPGRVRRTQIAHFARILSERQIDIVYDRTPHMVLITGAACDLADVPRISTIVSNPADDFQDNIGRFRWFKYRILKHKYRTAERVIANSEPLAQASREFYKLPDGQVTVLSNGFDFDAINQMASEEDSLAAVPASSFHIVASGRLEECKGFDILLDAVSELVNVRDYTNVIVTLAGRGSCEVELKHLAAQHCLEQVVRFVGFLENPYPLLQSADLFCLTSRYEGMPNVLVEAMSLGVPVLSTDCPHGPRDILRGGELGTLTCNLDPQGVADGIEQAIKAESAFDLRTAEAKESVLARFGIEPATHALEELLIRAAR